MNLVYAVTAGVAAFFVVAAMFVIVFRRLRKLERASVILRAAVLSATASDEPTKEREMVTLPRPQPSEASADGDMAPVPVGRAEICFMVDSLFLAACWRYLTSMGRNEVFHYVAGIRIDPDRYLLTHLIPVGLAEQSPGGVVADGPSSLKLLEQLDEWGVLLCGHMHSHPGNGAGATHPSATDRRFVTDLAAGSYVAVGAICSLDGFFRFFAHDDLRFRVVAVGNQIEEVSTHVFKLNHELAAGGLPVTIPRPFVAARGGRSGSPRPHPWL